MWRISFETSYAYLRSLSFHEEWYFAHSKIRNVIDYRPRHPLSHNFATSPGPSTHEVCTNRRKGGLSTQHSIAWATPWGLRSVLSSLCDPILTTFYRSGRQGSSRSLYPSPSEFPRTHPGGFAKVLPRLRDRLVGVLINIRILQPAEYQAGSS
jgi:hypothetical protein